MGHTLLKKTNRDNNEVSQSIMYPRIPQTHLLMVTYFIFINIYSSNHTPPSTNPSITGPLKQIAPPNHYDNDDTLHRISSSLPIKSVFPENLLHAQNNTDRR